MPLVTEAMINGRRKVYAALKQNPKLSNQEILRVCGTSFDATHITAFRAGVRQGLSEEAMVNVGRDKLRKLIGKKSFKQPKGEKTAPARVLQSDNLQGLENALRNVVPYLLGSDINEVVVLHETVPGKAPAISFKIGRRKMVYEEGTVVISVED